MKKKILIILGLICICICLSSCATHKHDKIDIWNKSTTNFDNVTINTKDGYFYDRHEKFTVDDNTIGVTIYFTKLDEGSWDNKKPIVKSNCEGE